MDSVDVDIQLYGVLTFRYLLRDIKFINENVKSSEQNYQIIKKTFGLLNKKQILIQVKIFLI